MKATPETKLDPKDNCKPCENWTHNGCMCGMCGFPTIGDKCRLYYREPGAWGEGEE